MSAKHTPGPWTLAVVDEDGNYTMGGRIQGQQNTSFFVEDHGNGGDDPQRAIADAALIAAAPDLLEACEAACELLIELGADGEPGDMPAPILEQLRAAIAKARGT